MESAISSKLMANVVSKASVTWRVQLFPKMVTISVSADKRASSVGSALAVFLAFRVEPNATILACCKGVDFMIWKNSMSFGLAPGHPPSMKWTPSSSNLRAMRTLSSTEKLTSSA